MVRSRLGVLAMCLVFAAIGASAYRARRATASAHEWVCHTYDVQLAIGAAREAVSGAEQGRGTRDDAMRAVRRVCRLSSDNAPERARCASIERDLAADSAGANATLAEMMATENTYLGARRDALDRAEATSLLTLRVSFITGVLAVLLLYAARERQRRAFAKKSAFFESVIESIGDAVLAAVPSGEIVIANAAAREAFPGARVGAQPHDAPLARALRGRTTDNFSFSTNAASGRRWINATARPVHDEAGALLGAVGVYRDVTADKLHSDAARALAVTDALTGCNNRRGFFMLAEQHAKLALRARTPFTVVFADLDGLKQINDVLGHEAGDVAIAETANILRTNVRESDIVARLGGDEFVVLAAQADARGVSELVARIQQAVARFNAAETRPYQIALSFGCATFDPALPQPLNELVAEADRKMYAVKRTRRRPRSVSSAKIATSA